MFNSLNLVKLITSDDILQKLRELLLKSQETRDNIQSETATVIC